MKAPADKKELQENILSKKTRYTYSYVQDLISLKSNIMKTISLFFAVIFLLVSCSKNKTASPQPQPDLNTLGAGWSTVIVGDMDIYDIDFINNEIGYLVGTNGLYKSTDGGHTWQLMSADVVGSYLAATANGGVFVISGNRKTVFSSFDGGSNFSAQIFDQGSPLCDLYFTGNDTGYIPTGKNTLYRTIDGGHNWGIVDPIHGLSFTSTHFIPFFINGHTGWISDGQNLFYSLGSVNSWSGATGLPDYRDSETMAISAVDANVVYTTILKNSTVSIYKSNNGGMSFSLANQIAAPSLGYTDIQFIDANLGYISSGNKIFATTDGGTNWQKVVSGPGIILEVDFADRNHGWACGEHGLVLIYKK